MTDKPDRPDEPVDAAALPDLIEQLCREHLPEGADFGASQGFFEAGLTSAHLAQVVSELRRRGVTVGMVDLFRARNLGNLLAALQPRMAGQTEEKEPTEESLPSWMSNIGN